MSTANAYLRVGDVQGLPYRPNLGDTRGALASYRKAQRIVQRRAGPLDSLGWDRPADGHD